jgi:Na+-driven multidrug efflux pump
MGVAGAGLASSLSVGFGVVLLVLYFRRLEKYVAFDFSAWRPQLATWGRLLRVGLPAGGEFALVFIYMGLMYWIIRRFGPGAQAGFGIGQRIMQSMFLPAMAVAFATAPIVGQNFGAGKFARVRETFSLAALISAASGHPDLVLSVAFGMGHSCLYRRPDSDGVGQYLQIVSWNFLAAGIVFTCSSVFQGLGHTIPAY